MSDSLEQLLNEAQAAIAAAADPRALEQLRIDFLGKRGKVTDLLKQLGGMAPDRDAAPPPSGAINRGGNTRVASTGQDRSLRATASGARRRRSCGRTA